ncbi:MAG: polysaccharide export protein [Gammaproteobacteria bacterium]|nr:polysaccharide export protein [Gammaproteobacteria bacterium]
MRRIFIVHPAVVVAKSLLLKRVVVGVLASVFFLAPLTNVFADSPVVNQVASGGEYEIGPEDLLDISVWKEKDLQKEVLVRPDGWITFPLVGNIQAKGKTALQLQEEITQWLKQYIPNPVVSVSVKKIAGYKIFVIGRVNKPGDYVVGRYIDVLQALSLAGGLTPFAEEGNIKIVRKENGKETILRFDYADVKKGRRLEQNITLRSGDVIIVP